MIKICIVIMVFVFLIVLNYKREHFDASTRADDCGKSVTDISNLLQAQKDEDTKTYNDANAAWRGQKQNIQNAFQSDLGAWSTACRGGACIPATSFYTRIPGVDHAGYDFRHFDSDLNTCAQTCLESDQCKWFFHEAGRVCWMKGNNYETGWTSAFKTNSGMKRYDNFHGYNDDYWEGDLPSFEACSNSCRDDGKCNMSTFNGRRCWKKKFHPHRGDTYVKEAVTPYKFPDNHPFIVNQIQSAPVMKRTEVKIGDIVCQDCRQYQDKLQVSDSKEIKIDQLNSCVANLKEKAAQEVKQKNETPVPSNSPNTSNTPNDTPNTDTPSDPSNPIQPPAQNNKKMYIGIGVTLGICFLILIGIIIIFFILKTKQEEQE